MMRARCTSTVRGLIPRRSHHIPNKPLKSRTIFPGTGPMDNPACCMLTWHAASPTARSGSLRRQWRRHAARLGRRRGGARLHRAAVRRGELRRSRARARPGRPKAAADLSAVARDLLHVVDVLRLGRACVAQRLRLSHDLHRPDADDRALRAVHHEDRAACQGAEHHLDRRLHRGALRQRPGGRCDRRTDRDRRHHSLHRAAAQGGVVLAQHDSRPCLDRHRPRATGAGRHCAPGRAGDGRIRGAVRHAAYRCHRAPGRPDAGDRNRVRSSS